MTTVFLNQTWPEADNSSLITPPWSLFPDHSSLITPWWNSSSGAHLSSTRKVTEEDRVESDVESWDLLWPWTEWTPAWPVSAKTHIERKAPIIKTWHSRACNPSCLEGRSRRITSSRPAWATVWIQDHSGQERQCLKVLKHKTQVKGYSSAVEFLCDMWALGLVAGGLQSA